MIVRPEPGEPSEKFARFLGVWGKFARFFVRPVFSAGGSRPENFQGFRSVYKGFPLPGEQVRTEMNRFEPFWNLSNGSQFLTNSKPGEQNPGFQTRRTESELFKPSEQNPDFQTGRTESWFSKPGEHNLKFPNQANRILSFQTGRTKSWISKPGEQNLSFPNRANRIWTLQTGRTEIERSKPGEQKLFQTWSELSIHDYVKIDQNKNRQRLRKKWARSAQRKMWFWRSKIVIL